MIGECVFHASQFEFTVGVLNPRAVGEGAAGKRTIGAFLGTILHRRGESRRFPFARSLRIRSFSIHCPLRIAAASDLSECNGETARERGLFGFLSDVYLARCVFVGTTGSLRWKRARFRMLSPRNWTRILNK